MRLTDREISECITRATVGGVLMPFALARLVEGYMHDILVDILSAEVFPTIEVAGGEISLCAMCHGVEGDHEPDCMAERVLFCISDPNVGGPR